MKIYDLLTLEINSIHYFLVTIVIETKQFSFCQIVLTLYRINRQNVHNAYESGLWMKY